MKPLRKLSWYAVVVVAASTVAACSSSGGGAPGTSSSSGPSPAQSSKATSAAATGTSSAAASLVPAAIRAKGILIDGTNPTYPPEGFTAKDGKTVIGADPDLAAAVGKVLGLKVKVVGATFDTLIPGLQDGHFDIVFSGMFDTKAREKVIDLVDYYQAGQSFYVKSDNTKKYDGLASLCGSKVAVLTGSSELANAQEQAKKCKMNVLSFANENDANLAVNSGRADVGFADSPLVGYLVRQSQGKFKETGQLIDVVKCGIGLPKGNGMAPAVIAALKELMRTGEYKQILAKWGMQDSAISEPTLNGATS